MAGYVYLIGTPVFKWYKIGKSYSPEVRVQELGILLPFKIEVIGVWKAENHLKLETELHDKYKYCQVNGEWFKFKRGEVKQLFNLLPSDCRVYPSENLSGSTFSKFTNLERDCPEGSNIHVVVRKMRGNFTPEERERRKEQSIKFKQERKIQKEQLKTQQPSHEELSHIFMELLT